VHGVSTYRTFTVVLATLSAVASALSGCSNEQKQSEQKQSPSFTLLSTKR